MPLPIIQTQNQQFAQELAAYRNATAMGMAEPELLQTNQPWEEFKNSAFQEYVRNQLDNTTTVFSSVVRERFLSTLGIGSQLGKSNQTPLMGRIGNATADILGDTAGYVYQGKSFGEGGKYSKSMNALRWFVPIAEDTSKVAEGNILRRGATKTANVFRRGRLTAGIRSYLGWNWMLGNPQDMSLGEHAWSLTKHVALSYGMDIALGKLMRNPGKIMEHLTSFAPNDFFKQFVTTSTGDVEQYFSKGLKASLNNYRKDGFKGRSNRNIRYRRLVSKFNKEVNQLPFHAKNDLYDKMKREMSSILSKSAGETPMKRIAGIVRNMISNSKYAHTGTARQSSRLLNLFSTAREAPTMPEKGLLSTANTAIKSSASWLFGGKTSGEVAARDVGALTSRMSRSALNLGGAAIRMANIASGAIGAVGLLTETTKYRDKLRTEYIKNMMSDSMAYSYIPEMGMSGTERTRAVEAIQNSSMGLRNFLGSEGSMMH